MFSIVSQYRVGWYSFILSMTTSIPSLIGIFVYGQKEQKIWHNTMKKKQVLFIIYKGIYFL